MIFQHTIDKVLDGTKTQTRRVVKPGDGWSTALSVAVLGRDYGKVIDTVPTYAYPIKPVFAVYRNDRRVYELGIKTYAAQPGRGKVAVARIRLTNIRREDVRNISEQDAIAEGFQDQGDFWFTWITMHDKRFLETYRYASDMGYLSEYGFYSRPPERYDAWVLTFELVNALPLAA